jgi:2-iminobutanoate/2-iminopropanoate deaminase
LLVEDWKRRFSLHERSGIQMIRERKWVLAAGFILVGFLLAGSGTSVGQEKSVIKLPGTEALPFSDGVIAGNTLYIAGQEGTDDKGKLAAGGIAAEAQAALANIEKIVKSAGFEMKDIVSVTVYLADIHEFGDMNKVYKNAMPDPKPARATVQVAALVNNARIEISAIAVKQK